MNYLDAVEKYAMYHEVNDTKYSEEIEANSIYQISNKEYIVPDGKTAVENKNLNDILGNTVKGEKPDTGIVEFDEKRKVVSASMVINNYNITCDSSTSCNVEGKDTDAIPILTIGSVTSTYNTITIPYTVEIEKGSATVECVYGIDENYDQTGVINEENNTCTLSNLTSETTYYFKLTPKSDKNKKGKSQISNITTLTGGYIAPEEGATHKGIVYLDPTDLEKKCTEKEATSNVNENGTPTEIKTGCMKWYVFDDNGDNYTMILDHNTTSSDVWDSGNVNVAYENSSVKPVVDKLVSESGWIVTPRLITAEEVNTITENTGFDLSNGSSYYFDSKDGNKTANADNKSKYSWLFDYMKGCINGGCEYEDDLTYAYWTSTQRGNARSYGHIWKVCEDGGLCAAYPYFTGSVRPVITVPKNIIK